MTVDDLGRQLDIARPVRRVVSLVPSLTESIAATAPGLLVGATDWCTHPADLDVRRIGGTKNPRVDDIVALRTGPRVANEEENRDARYRGARDARDCGVGDSADDRWPEALESLDRMLRVGCGLSRPGWLDAAVGRWQRTEPTRPTTARVWCRSGAGRGWCSDVTRSPATCSHGSASTTCWPASAERYPKVDLDEIARPGAGPRRAARRAVRVRLGRRPGGVRRLGGAGRVRQRSAPDLVRPVAGRSADVLSEQLAACAAAGGS